MDIRNLSKAAELDKKIFNLNDVRRELEGGSPMRIEITSNQQGTEHSFFVPMNKHCHPEAFPVADGAIKQIKMKIEQWKKEPRALGVEFDG